MSALPPSLQRWNDTAPVRGNKMSNFFLSETWSSVMRWSGSAENRAEWLSSKASDKIGRGIKGYNEAKVFKLVPRAGLDPKRIMGSLWAFKIKFNELGKFDKLNPRWCVKGYGMDKSI